jgi:hypothetical protein
VSGPVDVGSAPPPAAGQATPILWAPALFATCIGLPLLGLSALLGLFASVLAHAGFYCPPGTICLAPSPTERLVNLAEFLLPLVLGLALLVFTWRESFRGHRVASWALAAGTIVAGILSVV